MTIYALFFPAKTQSIFSRPLMFFYKLNNKKCINWCKLKWHVNNKLVAPSEWEITLKSFIFIVRLKNEYGTEIFDRDACRSGPTIHFVPDKTLVQNLLWIHGNLMFDKMKLMKPLKLDQIGSDWIRLDQIGSDWIRWLWGLLWGWLEDDLGMTWGWLGDDLGMNWYRGQL